MVNQEREMPTAEQIRSVKALGFLLDKRTGCDFNCRVLTRNGKISADQLAVISEAAQRFGDGNVTLTVRLTMEIQGVAFEKIQPLLDFLEQHGLQTGGTGAKVRPVVSCKGTTCQYGLIDTFALSERIHHAFYEGYHGVKLPHKFKIAVGGCPNNCAKPDLNDLGIVGQKIPVVDLEKCRGCKKCLLEKACPIGCARVAEGKIFMPEDLCNHCGRCVGKCPFGAVTEYQTGYKIYVGGRWGKKIALGQPLSRILQSEQQVMEVVESAILLFREQGRQGERFAETVARLGLPAVEEALLSGAVLARKEQILNEA